MITASCGAQKREENEKKLLSVLQLTINSVSSGINHVKHKRDDYEAIYKVLFTAECAQIYFPVV